MKKLLVLSLLVLALFLTSCDSHSTITTYTITQRVVATSSNDYWTFVTLQDGSKVDLKGNVRLAIGEIYTFTIKSSRAKDFWGNEGSEVISFKLGN